MGRIWKPAEHKLISIADVRRLTRRSLGEMLDEPDVQQLTRISGDGRREEMLRVPLRLLPPHE